MLRILNLNRSAQTSYKHETRGSERTICVKRFVICVLFVVILSSTMLFCMSASVQGGIQSISLTVTNTSYNSYTSTSPTVEIKLEVILGEAYSGGGYIELPLSRPTGTTHPGFYYGTNGTDGTGSGKAMPVFFVEGLHDAGNMVKSIDASGGHDVLVITLKNKGDERFATGLTTIILRFDFNPVWRGKVPANALMWNVAPVAYIDGVEAGRPAPISIKRDSEYGDAAVTVADAEYINYTGGVVTGSMIIGSASAGGSSRYLYFDPGYEFDAWLEIPDGSVLSAEAAAIWGKPVGVTGGYARYEAALTHGQGAINRAFTPPASIAMGGTFEVRGGISGFRYVNSYPNLSDITAPTVTYTKIDPLAEPQWALSVPLYDAPGAICFPVSGAVAGIYQQTSNTAANSHIYNSGTSPVTGVWLDFYQNTTGSPKVNFDEAWLSVVRSGAVYPWAYYKVDCERIDAITGVVDNITLGTWQATGAGLDASIPLSLPSLGVNQYINRIIVTPMGDDGASGNILPAGNGFGLSWRTMAWDSGVWPDGSGVSGYSIAMLGWKFYYDDNPSAPGGYPFGGGVPTVSREFRAALYYSQASIPGVAIVSSPPMFNATAGSVFDVTILGSNYFDALSLPGQWVNPRVMLRVPHFMVLVPGTGQSGTGRVTAGGSMDIPFVVEPELTYSDANYNYYSFQATGYSAPPTLNSGSYAFSIPASFEITSAAYAGSYIIYSLVSQLDAENFIMNGSLYDSMDNLPSGGAEKTAYGLDTGDHYYLSGYNALTVPILTAMTGVSAIKNEWTDDLYVSAAVVPAKQGAPAYLRFTLTNTGNVRLDNIRLYDIIPRSGDMLGSTGSLALDSINVSVGAPAVYYASPSAVLPTYGAHGSEDPNLQDELFWHGSGWSMTSHGADTMAILIDFSSSVVLGPGESVEVELLVQAPANAGLTAYNQFRYSARRQDDILSQYNFNGSIAGVATSAIVIEYDDIDEPASEDGQMNTSQEILPKTDADVDETEIAPAVVEGDVDDGGTGDDYYPPTGEAEEVPSLPVNRVEDDGVPIGDVEVPTGWMDEVINPLPQMPDPDMFTVLFVNWDGAVLDEQLVERGESAIAPPDPARSGYNFVGWDRDFTDIQSDLIITAIYYPIPVPDIGTVSGVSFAIPDSREFFEMLPWMSSDTILMDDDVPRMSFGNVYIPIYSTDTNQYVWALVNLILSAIGAILAAVTIFRATTRKLRAQFDMKYAYIEPEERKTKRQRNSWITTTITLGTVGVVVFVITQDMRRTMVLLDYWSITHAIIIVLEIVASLLSFRRNK